MELEKEYNQLTNIDIKEQKQLWDERGKGYYGEYLVFCELYASVSGTCKILMNLNVPVKSDETTEIDLLLIHETGLYVFEIKHYKGTIYGNDTGAIWTQYFRTAANHTFQNPVKQNKYHIDALKNLFPDASIHSVVVFTNNDCQIRVENKNSQIDILKIDDLVSVLATRFKNNEAVYSMEEIDEIFCQLSEFSPIQESIPIGLQAAPFYSWILPIISQLEAKKSEVEEEKNKLEIQQKELNNSRKIGIAVISIIISLCIAATFFAVQNIEKSYDQAVQAIKSDYEKEVQTIKTDYEQAVQKNNAELAEFKQNFLHVDEINNEYIDDLKSYVEVSNVSLVPLTDDAVSFTARIAITNDSYIVALTKNSKYIVMTCGGKVYEYDVFGAHLRYSSYDNKIGKTYRDYGDLAKISFYGINDIDDISYIKINNIELLKTDSRETLIKNGLEIELYSK